MGNLHASGGTRRSWWRSRKTVVLASVCLGAGTGAVALQSGTPGFMSFRGVAELVEYHPTARQPERVVAIPVDIGQWVRPGDIVAQLDTGPASRQLDVITAQLAQAAAQLEAQRLAVVRRGMFERRRFQNAIEVAQIGLHQARTQHETDKAQREGLDDRMDWWNPMVEAKAAPGETLIDLKAQAQTLDHKLPIEGESVKTWGAILGQVKERMREYNATAPKGDEGDVIEVSLAPYREAVHVLEAKAEQLQQQMDDLTVRSPGSGVVYKIDVRPGDTATPGMPIVQIRSPSTRHVMVYVSDVVAYMVGEGMGATVVPRDASGHRLKARVLALGSGMRPLPDQALPNPNWKEFGEEVVLELDEGRVLAPGQVVDVRFDMGHAPRTDLVTQAQAAPTPKGKEEPGRSLAEVPAALRERTRVEPSGLLWVPELDRFLVVTDDTGQAGRDEQAPWLLTMDKQGRFDDRPLVVEGIDSWNDLESITRAPDGTLWVLSSQNVSRSGKRPMARTLLVSLKVQNRRVVATGKASLSAALGAASAGGEDWLAGLGLMTRAPGFEKGVGGFDRELNIEGMTWDGDGLLLGLKRPVDAEGRAIVWRLSHPERLLATGKIDRSSLTLAARLPFKVGTDQREVAAGISDLLRLPDGQLIALAVAVPPKDGTASFPGDWTAMYRITPPAGSSSGASLWTVQKLRDFPGVKAEGVAVGPDPGSLVVVFDRDAQTPQWMTMPMPLPLPPLGK